MVSVLLFDDNDNDNDNENDNENDNDNDNDNDNLNVNEIILFGHKQTGKISSIVDIIVCSGDLISALL